MSQGDDPVLRHARKEAVVIGCTWLAATTYCCTYCYLFGYNRAGQTLGVGDLNPILGIPSWVFWGIIAPWVVTGIFGVGYALFGMVDDDLGTDHAQELDADIREEGAAHHG